MNCTKTAVSIPREVFEGGEAAAAELGISRSELYTQALRELLRARKIVRARARLDEAVIAQGAGEDHSESARALHSVAGATIRGAAARGESTW